MRTDAAAGSGGNEPLDASGCGTERATVDHGATSLDDAIPGRTTGAPAATTMLVGQVVTVPVAEGLVDQGIPVVVEPVAPLGLERRWLLDLAVDRRQ